MSDPMLPNQRSDFSAIVDRPPLKLPGGARIVIWTIVNFEVWDISRPMARQVLSAPTGQALMPDVPNWSWHEYGMRVGAWRFFDLYKRHNLRPTLSINARVCEDYPRVAQEAKDLGWEFMGHAYEQGPIHKVEDQRGMIFKSMDVIEKFTGTRPVGWLGPGLTQTLDTPDLLAEAGVKYIGDWIYDDEPTVIRTKKGPLVTLPYTAELNDIPMMIISITRAIISTSASSKASTVSMKRAPIAPSSCRSRSIPISAASRSASRRWKRSTTMSPSSTAFCTGTARRSSTGTPRQPT